MDLLIVILLFIYGILFGSFLNVLIDRFSTDRPVIKGRSYCENCHKTLSWQELIPLLSFLIQRGRCIHCMARIPSRLFVVELLTGIIFPLLYLWGQTKGLDMLSIIAIIIIIYSFLGIIFADLQYGLIPDKFLIISLFPILYLVLKSDLGSENHILSAFSAFAFFFLLFALTRGRGMGFGDVKLAFVLGLFLGFPQIVLSLYIAFLTGAFFSIILVLWGKKSLKKGTVPFGPYLVISAIISFFFGANYLLPLVYNFF